MHSEGHERHMKLIDFYSSVKMRRQVAATLTEVGLLLALIVVAGIVSLGALGRRTSEKFSLETVNPDNTEPCIPPRCLVPSRPPAPTGRRPGTGAM